MGGFELQTMTNFGDLEKFRYVVSGMHMENIDRITSRSTRKRCYITMSYSQLFFISRTGHSVHFHLPIMSIDPRTDLQTRA